MKVTIQTWSGRSVSLLDPTPDQIDLGDIAHSLSQQCRFGGHTKEFYSVAQHCVLVSRIIQKSALSLRIAMQGLLHDAAEAYVIDVPSPLKGILGGYKDIETKLERVIWEKFQLGPKDEGVKVADIIALATEATHLMGGCACADWDILQNVKPVPYFGTPLIPEIAEAEYLQRFKRLTFEIKEQERLGDGGPE